MPVQTPAPETDLETGPDNPTPHPYTRPYMTQFGSNPYARVQFAGVIPSRSVAACYFTASASSPVSPICVGYCFRTS